MARKAIDPAFKADLIQAFRRHPAALAELKPRSVERYATNEFDMPGIFWWLIRHPALLRDLARVAKHAAQRTRGPADASLTAQAPRQYTTHRRSRSQSRG